MEGLHRNILLVALGAFWLVSPAVSGSLSDDRIAAAVEASLARAESASGSSGLKVRCDEGILTLGGTAETLYSLDQAVRRAGAVPGVVEVQNRIAVTSETNVTAQGLARLVISRLTRDSSPVTGLFQVSIQGSVATLTGRVPLYVNRLEATEVVLAVPGIQQVDNRLLVDPLLGPPPSAPTRP